MGDPNSRKNIEKLKLATEMFMQKKSSLVIPQISKIQTTLKRGPISKSPDVLREKNRQKLW